MSKLSDELSLPVSLDEAESACHRAIADLGWKEDEDAAEGKIIAQVGFGLIRNPSRIEITLDGAAEGRTRIALAGRIMMIGPYAKSRIKKQVRELRAAIEAAAASAGSA